MENLLIGIGSLVIVNIGVVAYSYGKLSQKVNDLCRRVDGVDRRLNDMSHSFDKIEERVRNLETAK